MTTITSGSCLCGKVRFEIEGAFEHFFLCHCTYCQKDTGSAHASNLFSTTATLTWVSGQERVSTFHLPSSRHQKSFCSHCGSALPSTQMEGRLVVVPAGSLDDPLQMRPDAHLFMASKAAWDHELESVPVFQGLPTDRQP
ncbi:GFA family protein [Mangrovitalea sediminis]|uniref:GFA family protein n=1 Tax=Mangrovitalea sediminis TaxID=1982043 RepID=UPI000BE529D2|nr:GFA family protein [Mangrovitalea sediminis]